MSSRIQILCLKYGTVPPDQDETLEEMERIFEQYRDLSPLLKQIGEGNPDEQMTIRCGAFCDPDFLEKRTIVATLREQFPEGRAFISLNLFKRLCTVINFSDEKTTLVTTLGVGSDGDYIDGLFDMLKQRTDSFPLLPQLSPQDEIRHLLAGVIRRRRGLLIAGSPGWDSCENMQHTSTECGDKSNATLDATLNDANSIFHLFHSLTEDDYLAGFVSGFLIRASNTMTLTGSSSK